MTNDPQELGKGLFGYRRSAVNQILADRDIMLRQAEGRVRAAESKVAELESELNAMRERNSRMDEQLERLRAQFDTLAARSEPVPAPPPPDSSALGAPPGWDTETQSEAEPVSALDWEEPQTPVVDAPSQRDEDQAFGFGESEAAFPGLDGVPSEPEESEAGTPEFGYDAGSPGEGSIFDRSELAGPEALDVRITTEGKDAGALPSWMESEAEAPEGPHAYAPGDYASGDYAYEPFDAPPEPPEEPEPYSFPYDSDQFGDQPEGGGADLAFDEAEPADVWPSPADEPAAEAELSIPSAPEMPQVETAASAEPAPEGQGGAAESAAAQAPPGVSTEAIDLTNRFVTEEIQGILAAAEESAARIVERARATTQHQIAQSNRLWRDVQAEVSRFASWREEVEPVIRAVQTKVESVRAEIEEVPEKIRRSLAPMADSISSIDADLAELAAACTPPLLLTPTGLDVDAGATDLWVEGQPESGHEELGEPAAEGEDGSGHLAG